MKNDIKLELAAMLGAHMPPYQAMQMTQKLSRLAGKVVKIRIAQCNGELIPGQRDRMCRLPVQEYQPWSESIQQVIKDKADKVDDAAEDLQKTLPTGWKLDPCAAGGLFLSITGPTGKALVLA